MLARCEDQSAPTLDEIPQAGGETLGDPQRIIDDYYPVRIKFRWVHAAGGLGRQRVLIVLAGRKRLLEKEALAAAAPGGVDREHTCLIVSSNGEEKLVVQSKAVAGDLDCRAVRSIGHVEACELDVMRRARGQLQWLPFDRRIVEL